jgi:hypothetical protein
MKKGLSKVSSISSEMNDFTEIEGEKIYNVTILRLLCNHSTLHPLIMSIGF